VVHRFQDVAQARSRYGGKRCRFPGQRFGLFGYPRAYEDDAERARMRRLIFGDDRRARWTSGKTVAGANRNRTAWSWSRQACRERSTLLPVCRNIAPQVRSRAASTRKLLGRHSFADIPTRTSLRDFRKGKCLPGRGKAPSRTGSALSRGPTHAVCRPAKHELRSY